MLLLVGIRSTTGLSVTRLEKDMHENEAESVQIGLKTASVEEAKLKYERDLSAVERDIQRLETERELAELDIRKLGGTPIPESELDAMATSGHGPSGGGTPQEQDEEENEASKTEGEVEPQEASGEDAKFRILVVDDNAQLRDILRKALSRQNYHVINAEDGVEALNVLYKQNQAVDLVITDLNMPNVDGVALINNLPPGSRYIVISAYLESEQFRNSVERIEPLAILKKPFKLAELREAVEKARRDKPYGETLEPIETDSEPMVSDMRSNGEVSTQGPGGELELRSPKTESDSG